MRNLGIYVHIPFCSSKCSYCDFLSFPCGRGEQEKYVSKLCEEIKHEAKKFSDCVVQTIFFGGGTPTSINSEKVGTILKAIAYHYNIDTDAEISTEANPETVDLEKLKALCDFGFNRISFGVQVWQDHLLKRLSRIHTAERAESAYRWAREAGFKNINLDLMFGLPDQSMEDWEKSIDKTLSLNPEHISAYSLIMEEGTPLSLDKTAMLPSDEVDRDMYALLKQKMKQAGYCHYEISNFAKEGFACRHNVMYWQGGDYVGFGLGAHSFVGNKRYANGDDFSLYLEGNCQQEILETLDEQGLKNECMMLGLRMMDGVSEETFFNRFQISLEETFGDRIRMLIQEGLLQRHKGCVFLTEKGIDLSNKVFVEFL